MSDARLDQDVWLLGVNYLLKPDHVLGQLNDRAAHPSKAVDMFHVPPDAKPCLRYGFESLGARERYVYLNTVRRDDGHDRSNLIDHRPHAGVLRRADGQPGKHPNRVPTGKLIRSRN